MSSDAAKRATAKYQREKMESISIRVKRSEGLNDQIKHAAAVQGVKPAQFIKQAITAAINGPQPVQAPQPQPPATTAPADVPEGYTLIPCRPDQEPLKVLLPVDKHYNQRIQALVKAGRAPSRAIFVMQALDKHLSDAQPRDQYELSDEFFTGDPADNPPPLQ
jgi:hypothetical protein